MTEGSIPSGFGLSDAKQRRLIASLLPAFVDAGLSASDAFGIFKDEGFTVSEGAFNNLFLTTTDTEYRAKRIRFVNLDAVPSEGILEESTITLPRRYRMVANITYTDEITGETKSIILSSDMSALSTRGDMQADIIEQYRDSFAKRGQSILDARIFKGYISRR